MSYLVTLLTTTKGIGIDEGLELFTEIFGRGQKLIARLRATTCHVIAISFLSTTLLSKFVVLF